MSQLVARPGRNAARHAKKVKEIRKVTNAIQWHERERKKRQKLKQEQWESKQAVLSRIRWENENIRDVKRRALKNSKEDWRLGPLRPNRATGESKDKYGALTGEQMQKPEIPVRTQKNRNEVRMRKGLPVEYPYVVDDKKYFPIVKGDRVVLVAGKDKGKIGVVQDVIDRTHDYIVKGVNMQYFDSNLFTAAADPNEPKVKAERPVPLADIRLVVPYEVMQNGVKSYEDVVVEELIMERHTTGIDPYTGHDYGDAEIPEKHRYDPVTGLPIFHRYIAGIRHRIEWPWEHEEAVEDKGITDEGPDDRQTMFRKTLSTIRHPITTLTSWRSKDRGQVKKSKATEELDEQAISKKLTEIERQKLLESKEKPRSQKPEGSGSHDVDTSRNIVEGAESMSYSLVAPPFPDTLGEEIRLDIHDFSIETGKETREEFKAREQEFEAKKKAIEGIEDPEARKQAMDELVAPRPQRPVKMKRMTEQVTMAREMARERQRAADAMKTPMQLRWETEQAKKKSMLNTSPLVDTDSLLVALGQHMQKNAVQRRKAKTQVKDLD